MNVLVLLAHPRQGSLNHALAAAAIEAARGRGHTVAFHDLHAEGFEAVLPAGELDRDTELEPRLRRHCEEVAAVDGLVVVHPNWWGMPPALMVGWVDFPERGGRPSVTRSKPSGAGASWTSAARPTFDAGPSGWWRRARRTSGGAGSTRQRPW